MVEVFACRVRPLPTKSGVTYLQYTARQTKPAVAPQFGAKSQFMGNAVQYARVAPVTKSYAALQVVNSDRADVHPEQVPVDPLILLNAVANDKALGAGLRGLHPYFGDFVVRASGDAFAGRLIPQKVKVFITIILDIVHTTEVGIGTPYIAHFDMAFKQGAFAEELEEILKLSNVIAGFNKAAGAYGAWKELKELGVTPFGTKVVYAPQRDDDTACIGGWAPEGTAYNWKTDQRMIGAGLNSWPAVRARMDAINPVFGSFFRKICSEGWEGSYIPMKHKVFLALVCDISNGVIPGANNVSFRFHMELAAHFDASPAEIEELMKLCCVYCGFPKAMAAFVEFESIRNECWLY